MIREAKAEKALMRIERRLYAKGGTPKTRKQLSKLAQKFEGTQASVCAQGLAIARTSS